jgi:hypothetical protein
MNPQVGQYLGGLFFSLCSTLYLHICPWEHQLFLYKKISHFYLNSQDSYLLMIIIFIKLYQETEKNGYKKLFSPFITCPTLESCQPVLVGLSLFLVPGLFFFFFLLIFIFNIFYYVFSSNYISNAIPKVPHTPPHFPTHPFPFFFFFGLGIPLYWGI